MDRMASVEWYGGLRDGLGKISSQSGKLSNIPYSVHTRFEDEVGTNPEELIGSAHAACFTMALASELEKMGFIPLKLHTDATVTLGRVSQKWEITKIDLNTFGDVPGADYGQFRAAAEEAKANCPVSRLLRAPISHNAKLIVDAESKRAG